jgi:uncharacterized protein DUF3592
MSNFITLAAIVGVMFLIGIVRAIRTQRFVRNAARVRARIVDRLDSTVANPDTSSQSAPVSRYVIELADHGTQKRRVPLADAFGGSIADKFVADEDTIPVIYDPRRPNVVRINSPWTLYFAPVFLCTPGVLFLALVAYVWMNT